MSISICCQKSIFFGIGSIFLVVGLLMASTWPYISNTVLRSELSLKNGSNAFNSWVETPIPMYLNVYLFNWTNSNNLNEKPKLDECGPYVFSEKRFKVNLKWHDNGTITYQQYRRWIFHQELSNGSLSDMITNINILAVTVGSLCKDIPLFEKVIISRFLDVREELIVSRNTSQWLFEGYNDPILQVIQILKDHNVPVPIEVSDKFGWFYQRNMSMTADGVFTIDSGMNDIDGLGNIVSWNGKTKEPFYQGACAEVKGSIGEVWSPYSSKKSSISLYAYEIGGSINLSSSGTYSIHNLTGETFIGKDDVFDNGQKYRENRCYCKEPDKCPATGVRDISGARHAPVFMSFPHFYLANKSYLDAVEGLNPDRSKHQFSISLEDKTGLPLKVLARLQINVFVQKIQSMSFFKIPNVYMPMIWFEQSAEITPELAEQVKPLSMLMSYALWTLVSIAFIGLILVLTGLFLQLNDFWGGNMTPSQSQQLLHENS